MKRFALTFGLLLSTMLLPMGASAQIDLSKAFGALLGATETTSEKNPLELIAESAPTSRDVVRTWAYDRLYFEYIGSNPLADVALQQLDVTVQAALKREGIVSGAFTLTLRRNGTGFIMRDGAALDGKYSYNETKGRVEFSVLINGTSYPCGGFFKLNGKDLIAMVDARDVFNIYLAESPQYSNDPTALTIQGILDSFKGVFISLYFTPN
jgi:hypothetical protein